jgi:hypothetical protein
LTCRILRLGCALFMAHSFSTLTSLDRVAPFPSTCFDLFRTIGSMRWMGLDGSFVTGCIWDYLCSNPRSVGRSSFQPLPVASAQVLIIHHPYFRSTIVEGKHSNNSLQKNQNYRLSLSFLVTVSTGGFTLDQSYSIIQNKLLLATDCLEDSLFYSLEGSTLAQSPRRLII